MQRFTLRPGDARLPINLGEATSTIFNEGLGAINYADSETGVAIGALAPSSNVTLAGVVYLWANIETTVRVRNNSASSLAAVSAQLVAQDARLDVLDTAGLFYLPAPSGSAALDTSALVALDAAVVAAGGGTIIAQHADVVAPYKLNAAVMISSIVNLKGAGKGATIFLLTTAGARIEFADGEGGASGGFSIHGGVWTTLGGAYTATVGLKVNACNQRRFHDIDVRYIESGADAYLLSGTQNCTFQNCTAYYCYGNGFAITNSAGSNQFNNCGGRAIRGWDWEVRQDALDPHGIGFNSPLENVIIGGVHEALDETGGPNGLGLFHQTAGTRTRLLFPVFAEGTTDDPAPELVVLEKQSTFGVEGSGLEVVSPSFSGSAVTTIFEQRGNTALTITGLLAPNAALNLFRLTTTDLVNFDCTYSPGEVEHFVDEDCAGFATWPTLIRRRLSRVPTYHQVAGASDQAYFIVDDAGTSFITLHPNQLNFNGDLALYRAAAGTLGVTNGLKLGVPKAATSAQALEVFVDSATGKLSFKDAGGVTNVLY